jgi:hypothetical protein
MAHSDYSLVAQRAWHRLQAIAAQNGSPPWLILGTKRTLIIAHALEELGDLGVEGLVLAIEGYAYKTREWTKRNKYFNPESIFRVSNLAKNVEAGALYRSELRAEAEQKAADVSLQSATSLWD